MGKEIDDLRRFRAELNSQDRILQSSADTELPIDVSVSLKRLLKRIGEAFPELSNLAASFSAHAQASVLRSQIAEADAAIASQIEAWEHILDLRVSAEKAAKIVDHCLEKGNELLMEAPGSRRDVGVLGADRQDWIDETKRNLEKVFVSEIYPRQFLNAVNTTDRKGSVAPHPWGQADGYEGLRGTIRSGITYLEKLRTDFVNIAERHRQGVRPDSDVKGFVGARMLDDASSIVPKVAKPEVGNANAVPGNWPRRRPNGR